MFSFDPPQGLAYLSLNLSLCIKILYLCIACSSGLGRCSLSVSGINISERQSQWPQRMEAGILPREQGYQGFKNVSQVSGRWTVCCWNSRIGLQFIVFPWMAVAFLCPQWVISSRTLYFLLDRPLKFWWCKLVTFSLPAYQRRIPNAPFFTMVFWLPSMETELRQRLEPNVAVSVAEGATHVVIVIMPCLIVQPQLRP